MRVKENVKLDKLEILNAWSPVKEIERQNVWANGIHEQRQMNEGASESILHDGPPYASNWYPYEGTP